MLNKSSLLALNPPLAFGAAGCVLLVEVVATGLACPHSPKSSSPLTVGAALLALAPKALPLVELDPHPPKSPIPEAEAVVVDVEVVGLASDHAFEEPHASKFDVRFMEGDLAAAGAGAGAGAGFERLNAELLP